MNIQISEPKFQPILRCLTNATRVKILSTCISGTHTMAALASICKVTQGSISTNVKALVDNGLVEITQGVRGQKYVHTIDKTITIELVSHTMS